MPRIAAGLLNGRRIGSSALREHRSEEDGRREAEHDDRAQCERTAHAPRASAKEMRPSLMIGVNATRATAAAAETTPTMTRSQVRPRPPNA